MKRTSVLLALLLLASSAASCALAAAPDPAVELAREIAPLLGTSWYGVYFAGKQKCGFAKMVLAREKWLGQEVYAARMMMDVNFQMGAISQKLVVNEARYYKLTGELLGLESATRGVMGETKTRCEVKGDKLLLTSTVGGHTTREELPVPGESLVSAIGGRRLIRDGKVGATIKFTVFETTLRKPITIVSKLVRVQDRVIGGVKTRIGIIESEYVEFGITSREYVTADGELLETIVAKMFALRKEPEKVAKDVRAAFDIIRAGTIRVKKRLGDRTRITSLKLRLSGIKRKEAMIDDDRQRYERGDELAGAHIVTLTPAQPPAKPLSLPLKLGPNDKEIAEWLKPSAFTQSDAPEIVKAARKIVGDETDSLKAASKIQAWVYENVDKKFLAAMSNAVGVLKRMEGDCSEHSVLFVALCRAAGIPARQAVGVGYSNAMKAFGYHAWGEVYVGKWVAMDPTWGENFADATHLKFGLGDTESLGTIGALFGSLKIEVLDVKRK